MKNFTYGFSIISIVSTLLPFIKSSQWWIRIFDFPRSSIALFCLISIILCLVFLAGRGKLKVLFLSLLGISLFLQVSKIIFYTPLYPSQAKKSVNITEENKISLIVTNVKMDNKEIHKLKNLITKWNPDVILINEPDEIWAKGLLDLEEMYPFFIKEPLSNTYGMILYSKLALSEEKTRYLVSDEIPSIATKITLKSGDEVMLYGLHPEPPKPGTDTYERDTEILIVGQEIKGSSIPVIVAGDLNDVAWSYTSELFQKYAELVDPREGVGMFNTYNAKFPLFRYPLDHIFYSKEFGLNRMELLEDIGSDHFPVYIELTFEPVLNKNIEMEKTGAETQKEVQETIDKGK